MADQGFTALEDNGLMGRPVDVQAKIGETLARRGMTMGVFVIDGGDNWKTSLATGKAEFRDKFLATCRTAVEVGKRVNANWATVVPGYFERKLPIGIQTGQCHRHPARRRGDPRASQPHHGARAAVRQPGPVPAHLGPGVRDLPRGR